MNKFANSLVVAILALFALASSAHAQVVTLTSTTTSAAVAASDKVVCLAAATGVAVPGNGTLGSALFMGKETMRVQSVTSTSTCFNVARSARPVGHASGATVYVGKPNQFYAYNPEGTCVVGSIDVRPWINTATGEVSDCVSSLWTRINGPATAGTGLTSLGPNSASAVDIGSASLPFRTLYGTTSLILEGATADAFETTVSVTDPTADRTVTIPDASFTVSGATATDCGTSAGACSQTAVSTTLKMVFGTATSTSASPSTVAITGMPAFTSSATYKCNASNATTATNDFTVLTAGYVSTTAVTFTGPNTLTDVIRWYCIGY